MRPFAALERFFERLFERPTARLFHARLQPVQLQRRVERALENGRLSAADRVLVPNRFDVRLHPDDLAAFGDLAVGLQFELADAALAFARSHRYTLADRPRVQLRPDRRINVGDVRVEARFVDPDGEGGAEEPSERVQAGRDGHLRRSKVPAPSAAIERGTAGSWVAADAVPAEGVQPFHTRVFEVPQHGTPPAVFREIASDGSEREIMFEGGPLAIGRASDNDLVLSDSRVSRYHGRVLTRRGALVYSDLGSTNGTRVNGVPVEEVVLGEGDRIEIGDTTLVVERVPGA